MAKIAKNLFIVRSPLQVINAYEASQYFETKNNTLILVHNSTLSNKDQTRKIIDMLNVWDEIIEIENRKSKFFQYVKLVKKLKKSIYEKVFIGGFSTLHKIILANLKYQESYMIDDGTATLLAQKTILEYFKNTPLNYRELRFLLFFLKAKIRKNIHFFTFFNLDHLNDEVIIKHQFTFLKKKYLQNDLINDDNVYVLGQNLVSEGMIGKTTYLFYINQIIQRYPSKNIVYIPHRSEGLIEEIKKFESPHFQILKNDMPIEIFFLSKGIYPSIIVSFFSTALYTLSAIFPKSKVESFLIPVEDIQKGNETIAICQGFLKNTPVVQASLQPHRENT